MRTLRVGLAAGAVAAVLLPGGSVSAQDICVRVTVTTPLTGTHTTGYTCTATPVSTWYRDVVAGGAGFEVVIEVITPAVGSR